MYYTVRGNQITHTVQRKGNIMDKDIKKLAADELDAISGGRVQEYKELQSALTKNPSVVALNAGDDDAVTILDKMGISADINTGLLGTGINSKTNVYKDKATGQTLTHEQVIARISNYKG